MKKMSLKLITYSALLYLVLVFTGCAATRQANQLESHKNMLLGALDKNVSVEKKMDALAGSMLGMMNQSLKILNPKKGVDYVKKYSNQNQGSIESLVKQIGTGQQEMKVGQKIAFGLKMVQKPYMKDLIALVPKFKRKYNQLKFAMKLLGTFKKGLTGMVGNKLQLWK